MLLSTSEPPLRLLVLCTGNSARSIIAEELFNRLLGDHVKAFSAGSNPTGLVNPLAMEQLSSWSGDQPPRSKSWDEFLTEEAAPLDIVLTVCGNAGQSCPQFPGMPERVHWNLSDPAAITGSEQRKRIAFSQCYSDLHSHVAKLGKQLRQQPLQSLEPAALALLMQAVAP